MFLKNHMVDKYEIKSSTSCAKHARLTYVIINHNTSTILTDRRTDTRLAVAIPRCT